MSVKVAINGFGRIGRLAFRQMFDAEGYEVVAISMIQLRAVTAERSVRTFTQLQLMMRLVQSLLTARHLQSMQRLTLQSFLGARSALT